MIKTGLFALALAAALPPGAGAASIIFSNFGPSLAYDVTQGNPVGNDFAGDNAAEGDSFIPTASANFGSVSVALSCVVGCPAADSFVIALTADMSDAPGAVLESFSFTGASLGSLGTYNNPVTATSVLQPLLTAGTRYWITVASSPAFAIAWNDNSTSSTVDQAVSSDGGSTWFSPSGMTPSAFDVLSTTTPEPSAALLLSGGLLMILWGRRLRLPVVALKRAHPRS